MTAPPALRDDLLNTIAVWREQDPDPVTRSQADDLVDGVPVDAMTLL